jgi:pyrroline-5-carboxylate reductase
VSKAGAAEAQAAAGPIGEILLVGCGKMGGAMLEGWLARGIAAHATIVEPGPGAANFARRPGVALHADVKTLASDLEPDVVVFAVKPQMMDAVAPHYRRFAGTGAVILSIAAGKTISYFERRLGTDAAIVRAMPNTPASVGRGITVSCANARVTPAQRSLCDRLLAAVGEIGWVEDEALIDAVTAVSGSGPAYVFLLIECMAEAGIAAGLPAELAMRLARATVAGSGELARLSTEAPAVLRQNVTSPGGTTRAALDVLMAPGGLAALMTRAIAAAAARARELAEE